MTEEEQTSQEIEAQETGPTSGDAWREVAARLDDLGDAITRWARATKDDPDNRRRATELKERIEAMGRQIGDVLKQAGGRFSEEVAPRMASAFDAAADKLRDAAERSEQKEASESEPEPEPEAPEATDG